VLAVSTLGWPRKQCQDSQEDAGSVQLLSQVTAKPAGTRYRECVLPSVASWDGGNLAVTSLGRIDPRQLQARSHWILAQQDCAPALKAIWKAFPHTSRLVTVVLTADGSAVECAYDNSSAQPELVVTGDGATFYVEVKH